MAEQIINSKRKLVMDKADVPKHISSLHNLAIVNKQQCSKMDIRVSKKQN
jgi:hypothetical protein